MLEKTHINGERIAAVFPCIGDRLMDCAVITIREDEGKISEPFSLHRVSPRGESLLGVIPTFSTFPQALRAARQSQGWG
jgi:hypothetical protein